MKRMGMMALYRRPTTSHPTPGHQIYPYLLRKVAVTKPNQVLGNGHHVCTHGAGVSVYLVAVVDWFSRKVLAWRLSMNAGDGAVRGGVERSLGSAWEA